MQEGFAFYQYEDTALGGDTYTMNAMTKEFMQARDAQRVIECMAQASMLSGPRTMTADEIAMMSDAEWMRRIRVPATAVNFREFFPE